MDNMTDQMNQINLFFYTNSELIKLLIRSIVTLFAGYMGFKLQANYENKKEKDNNKKKKIIVGNSLFIEIENKNRIIDEVINKMIKLFLTNVLIISKKYFLKEFPQYENEINNLNERYKKDMSNTIKEVETDIRDNKNEHIRNIYNVSNHMMKDNNLREIAKINQVKAINNIDEKLEILVSTFDSEEIRAIIDLNAKYNNINNSYKELLTKNNYENASEQNSLYFLEIEKFVDELIEVKKYYSENHLFKKVLKKLEN